LLWRRNKVTYEQERDFRGRTLGQLAGKRAGPLRKEVRKWGGRDPAI